MSVRRSSDPLFSKPTIADALLFFVITLLAALYCFSFSAGDIDTYLPFILHAHDPALFKNDLLLGTLPSHPVYIWKFLAFFLRWTDIGTLIRMAFILQTLLIASGAALFFRNFFGPGKKALLFLVLLVIPVSSPGYGMFGINPYGYFHAGAVAFGLVLITYTLIDRGFWTVGGILTGSIFLFHPVTALYAAGFFSMRAVLAVVDKKRTRPIVSGAVLLCIIALPSLLPAFHTFLAPKVQLIDPGLWKRIARLRMNHGYFVSTWVADRFVQLAACFAALFFLFRNHHAFKRLLPVVVVVACGLLLMSLADLLNIRFFLRLQLGRCSYYLYFLVAAFAVDAVANTAPADSRRDKIIRGLSALALLALYGNGAITGQPEAARDINTILVVAGIVVVIAGWFNGFHPRILTALLIAIVVTTVAVREPAAFRWTKTREQRDPWTAMATECKERIPRDSVVLIPLTRQDFRAFSCRATYCSWKDCAPHLFCDSTLVICWKRFGEFGVTLDVRKSELDRLYHDRALAVARGDNIRYVVFDKALARATGPVAYENKGFGLLDLDAGGGEQRLVPLGR